MESAGRSSAEVRTRLCVRGTLSNKPLQPMSSATGLSRVERTVSAARLSGCALDALDGRHGH